MIIQGRSLHIFHQVNGAYKLIASSDSCALDISCSTVAICCRGSLSARHRRGRYSWSVDVSGLTTSAHLVTQIGQPLDVVVSVIWGDLQGVSTPQDIQPNSEVMLSGKVYIVESENSGSRGAAATWRLSLQGDGRLTVGVPTAVNGFPYTFPLIFV